MSVSKIGIFTSLMFVLLCVAYRLVLPFGDEPDFQVKANKIRNGDDVAAISVVAGGDAGWIDVGVDCSIKSSPFSLSTSIRGATCQESIKQVVLRVLATVLAVSPLLICSIFRRQLINFLYAAGGGRSAALVRCDAVSISLLFSGFIYYVGLLSVEQTTLVLSVLAFLFIDKKLLVLLLLLAIFYLDFGNAVVASAFFSSYYVISVLKPLFGRGVLYSAVLVIVIFAATLGPSVLSFLPENLGELSSKADAMYYVLTVGSQAERLEKYPLLVRPLMTLASFVLFTPNYVKSPIAYVVVAFFAFFALLKGGGGHEVPRHVATAVENYVLAFLVCVGFFSMSFPTYANGKYYIFMLPVVFCLALQKFRAMSVYFWSIILSLLTAMHVFFYRVA